MTAPGRHRIADQPIGRRIAQLRARRGLTQQVFANRIGKPHSWVDKVERGIRCGCTTPLPPPQAPPYRFFRTRLIRASRDSADRRRVVDVHCSSAGGQPCWTKAIFS
ncbi:helix-turn-helix domain-containing protein [Solwaraspora sp. WMMA2080]|uniref:helix-turn-helix domain-containing protein n=1 Tax=unclassified Solwaraspora TaxID=2627926 RepID=UPI00248C219A|nr:MULTISPECIES: helix-turn-helix domain-containing protein [unclassified Solwaraspora]WBB96088.1 helix-turn-helix domain-containing protein [Solwaraspora sp. WMMA2059]WBC20007.1 helix-turn-helix domain-containing protein [Solwaraspora sp. WMMA2080]